MRTFIRTLQTALVLTACFWLGHGQAAVIRFDVSNVGGAVWQYDYSINNDSLTSGIDEFTIYFDRNLYDSLVVAASPADWDSLVVQPDPAIPADGFFDSLAIAGALPLGETATGFSVRFTFSGVGSPRSQHFEIVDTDFNIVESGATTSSSSEVPEPGSLSLMLIGAIAIAYSNRRRMIVGFRLSALTIVWMLAAASIFFAPSANALPTVTGMSLVTEKRVGRTVFDLTYRITVKNDSEERTGVIATLIGVGAGTSIQDASVVVGALPANITVQPLDTIVVRHDRNQPFRPDAFVWQFTQGGPPAGGLLPGADGDAAVDRVGDVDVDVTFPATDYETDSVSGGVYLRTVIAIAFKRGATVGQVNAFLRTIGGTIVQSFNKTALLYVRIPDPGSVAALRTLIAGWESQPFIDLINVTSFPPTTLMPGSLVAAGQLATAAHHHMSARAHAAWNARAAIAAVGATPRPAVVILDNFGDGQPAIGYALGFANGVDLGFLTTVRCFHGYHVAGILGAAFSDGSAVTGLYPGDQALATEILDRQGAGSTDCNKFIPPASVKNENARLRATIGAYEEIGRKVIVNTSLGWNNTGTGGTVENATRDKAEWLRLIRGGFGDSPRPVVESNYFHAVAAGNNAAFPARVSIGYAMAAIDGDLHNTAVVENRTASVSDPFTPGCLNASSSRGGNISAFGTDVYSYSDSHGGATPATGTSMAAPQVAGLAAYLWMLKPDLSSELVLAVLRGHARTVCDGSPAIDAYATVLSADEATGLTEAGHRLDAPVRSAILDVSADGSFKEEDAETFVQAFEHYAAATAFDPSNKFSGKDPSRFDLNGDGKVGGAGTERFNLDASKVSGISTYGTADFEYIKDHRVKLDENAATDFQVLCFNVYSKLFTGDLAVFEKFLADRGYSCAGPRTSVGLRIDDTHVGWVGLPASIELTDLYATSILLFQILGNSATCGTGERGTPLYSESVDLDATFMGARTVTGVPSAVNGPPVNRRNCSSFIAFKTVVDPTSGAPLPKIWVNATGRGQQFGGPAVFDWEYQVRYYSGDPLLHYADKSVVVGTVPGSGIFVPNFFPASVSYVEFLGPPGGP